LKIEKQFQNSFQKINDHVFWLPIHSGTIEMNDNKIIVLAD